MEKKITLRKPKWLRRITSAFLDLMIAFILALLFSFLTNPIVNLIYDGEQLYKTYCDYAVSTKLYIVDENNNLILNDSIIHYDENLTYFYLHCTDNKIDEYNAKKSESSLFYFDNESQSYLEIPYDYNDVEKRNEHVNFYQPIRDYCLANYIDNYLNSIDDFKKVCALLNKIDYINLLLCSSLSLLVVYLLIPIINKDGNSIGKMAFKLKIISKINIDLKPSKLQIIFRQLVLIVFELLLTISTIGFFGIPLPLVLILSIVLMIFTKYNQTFHDLCCSTIVIDNEISDKPIDEGSKYSLIFYYEKEK
ncbi:MAG: RDD family protein [Erysipelotrichaceae bacterium]|nr:RDD family protein [Erysipelotrichaceae bacterium]